jgi:hypothetical protein
MVVVPLSQATNDPQSAPCAPKAGKSNWATLAAGGSLVAGGLLLLTGYRRSGTALATAGAVVALLDQKETLRSWWDALPFQIDEVQRLLGHVQGTIEDLDVQRDRLRQMMAG